MNLNKLVVYFKGIFMMANISLGILFLLLAMHEPKTQAVCDTTASCSYTAVGQTCIYDNDCCGGVTPTCFQVWGLCGDGGFTLEEFCSAGGCQNC
jgi:hypothetical protein